MRSLRRMLLVFLTVLPAATTVLHAKDKAEVLINVSVDGQAVSATGLTPGGAAAVLTSWRVRTGGSWYSSQTWRDARVDAGGAIRVTFNHTFPQGALLAVVDVSSGRVQLQDVGSARFERTILAAKRLKHDDKGDVEELSSPNESAFIVLVRPGDGIWVQIASDGGTGDDDGRVNGRVRTDPANLQPIAGSGTPPRKIKSKDLLFVMDDVTGVVSSAEVTQ